MLLILGFAESSSASDPIFAQGQGGPEGVANEAVDRPFGISNCKFQIGNLRSVIRYSERSADPGGPQGTGPDVWLSSVEASAAAEGAFPEGSFRRTFAQTFHNRAEIWLTANSLSDTLRKSFEGGK